MVGKAQLFVFSVALSVWLIPSPALAAPRKVKITGDNLATFQQVPGQPYFCYSGDGTPKLGTVSKGNLRPKAKWTPVSTAKLEKSLAKLNKDLAKLEKKGKTATSKYQKSFAKRQSVSNELNALLQLIANCENPNSDDGIPPSNPVPTPPPTQAPPTDETPSPDPFSGNLNSLSTYHEHLFPAEVEHLLNKVALGGTDELRQIGNSQGLTALVNALVDEIDPSASSAALEQQAGYWISQGMYHPDDEPTKSQWTVWAAQWGQYYRFFYSRNPLREYMSLLLSGQFAVNLTDINFAFNDQKESGIPAHIERLRRLALGNFLHLSQEMTTDNAMMVWLNNVDNHIGAPNQNYAREFLELFVLGAIDPITGNANYDERSIVASTGFFSGWSEQWYPIPNSTEWGWRIIFDDALRDKTSRTVFPGVAGAELNGSLDWVQFPEHVLSNHPGSARYITERLFAQLVHPEVPAAVVTQLAADFRASGFELKPLLKKILKSSAMFSPAAIKPCIASPVEWETRLYRKLVKTPLPTTGPLAERGEWLFWSLVGDGRQMGQIPFEPVSVFGWKGACGINRAGTKAYGEGFVSAQKVLNRDRACATLVSSLLNLDYNFAALFPSTSMTPEQIIRHIATTIFDLNLTDQQMAILVRYMTNVRNDQGQLVPVQFSLSTDWMVKNKIPRLICLLQGFLDNNLR